MAREVTASQAPVPPFGVVAPYYMDASGRFWYPFMCTDRQIDLLRTYGKLQQGGLLTDSYFVRISRRAIRRGSVSRVPVGLPF